MIALDTNALYRGKASGPFQERARERMTLAVYNEARNNRAQVVIWSVVAAVHIMIVLFALGLPGFVEELKANPNYLIGLAVWLAGDVIFLAFAPKLYHHFQEIMDRLERKTPSRR